MEAVEYNRMAALHAQRWLGLGSTVYLSLGKAKRQRLFQHENRVRKTRFLADLTTPYLLPTQLRSHRQASQPVEANHRQHAVYILDIMYLFTIFSHDVCLSYEKAYEGYREGCARALIPGGFS